jgi:pyridoxal phosphate enzyme (YggS family)
MDRKQELASNLEAIESRIESALRIAGRERSEITLIVVTKNFPASDVELLYQLGVRDFGENRDQEARAKIEALAAHHQEHFSGVRWHYQGQLQSNKLASIASWADLVHSVDQVRHLKGLSDGALRSGRKIRALIQLSLEENQDPGRGGTNIAGAEEILSAFERDREQLAGLSLVGVMAVAPLGESPRKAFDLLSQEFHELATRHPLLEILSAGMSGDFAEALIAGATHIRIGTSILGSRM